MKKRETFFSRWESAKRFAYTLLMRGRFASWGARSRLEPGAKLVAPHLVWIGERTCLCEHIWLNARDDRQDGRPTLHIGHGAYIGRFAHINAWREVRIGNNVLIADRVFISDISHRFDDPTQPVIQQGDEFKGAVHLQEGCWIGTGAIIFPGVTVGRFAVVGANAVVTKDVPERAVVAGVPARLIRQR